MKKTLLRIAQMLNGTQALWAVGGSMMLSLNGIVDDPRDIDILVATDAIELVESALARLGSKKERDISPIYVSEHFLEYTIGGIDIDVISGFRLNTAQGLYRYAFDARSVCEMRIIEEQPIPLGALEEWYVLYQLMPGREGRVLQIEEALIRRGIRHPLLLERMLEGTVPSTVRERTAALLKNGGRL